MARPTLDDLQHENEAPKQREIVRRLEAFDEPADIQLRIDAAAEIMRLRRLLLEIRSTADAVHDHR